MPLRAMRFLPPLLAVLSLAGCAVPAKPEPAPRALESVRPPTAAPSPQEPPAPPSPPAAAGFSPRVRHATLSGIHFEGVEFDARSHRLTLIDQPAGPGSRFADAAGAGRSVNGIAAVNAGFFTPEGAPLGLVVHGGKTAGSWNPSSLGSGLWLEDPAGGMAIQRREAVGRPAAGGMRELLQAGPLLVENHRPVSGLNPDKTSVRTVILWDGNQRWWIGCGSPCTLAHLGQALGGRSPAGWQVRQALNLDGGRSADLWISSQVDGGPLTRRPLWNRPVRNFLALSAR